MWRDGDRGYTVRASGNGFERTGGDDGEITGPFFGPSHEGMGGVLEREDLAAGFGGQAVIRVSGRTPSPQSPPAGFRPGHRDDSSARGVRSRHAGPPREFGICPRCGDT